MTFKSPPGQISQLAAWLFIHSVVCGVNVDVKTRINTSSADVSQQIYVMTELHCSHVDANGWS